MKLVRVVMRALAALLAAGAALHLTASALGAQLNPAADWRTIRTTHFYVHFTPEVEEQARRAAVNAERAYAQLASELHPPRGMIDLVIADNVDFSNGFATPSPTNRIVIYATPPVSESALRFTDDWNAMVVTHELTHIFHLDRVRGIWALGQHVFGRATALFPNTNAPSWLTEGLAVHYESKFTGAGRLRGSEHRAIALAAASDHRFPSLDQLSLASPRFPFGEVTYAYGSLIVDRMAALGGPGSVRAFVDRSSAQLIPFALDYPARKSFGRSFTAEWRKWRDSLGGVVPGERAPVIGWRELTSDGVIVSFPRWLSDSALTYSGTPGKESFGVYEVTLGRGGDVAAGGDHPMVAAGRDLPTARRTRIGRRNSRTPNVRLPDGSLLFSQIEFTSPYEERSDLYVQHDRGENLLTALGLRSRYAERRLTTGQRLASPDARGSDGAIVAVQIVPAGTRLVRVSGDGSSIAPITGGGIDETWSEPRWSHAGDRIAAVRWRRDGISEIVVLDSIGRELAVVASGHSVQATPSWTPDDGALVYSSDRTGEAQAYLRAVPRVARAADADGFTSAAGERQLTAAVAGIFEPQIARDSTLAAVELRGNGYRLGVANCCAGPDTLMVQDYATTSPLPPPPVAIDSAPATRYSPWRTLWPRYWLPELQEGMFADEYRLGATTSGRDVIGRHSYDATVYVPTRNSGITWFGSYRYAGLGLPILQLSADQDWALLRTYVSSADPNQKVGDLRRRIREADLAATWVRQRVRTAASFSLGAGVEHRDYVTVPRELMPLIDSTGFFAASTFPRVFASAGFSNVQYPVFAISAEDGLTAAVTVRERLKSGFGGKGPASTSIVGTTSLFKSLDLPGFAHHVLALRAAGGWMDLRSNAYFEAGGVSGTPIEIVSGYFVGEGRRTFPVRGFQPGSLVGVRAVGGTVAYRAPLYMAGRGYGTVPFFVDKASLELFGEGARAWCPSAYEGRQVCTADVLVRQQSIASVGGELQVTTAILSWDDPYRLRLGVAVPVRNTLGERSSTVYFAAGVSF